MFLLLEDGTSKLFLEDGASYLLLEADAAMAGYPWHYYHQMMAG